MPDALPRVFISYARADSTAFVDRLEGDLKAQQFHPWVDRHGLEGGQEWMEIIQDAIDACQALVVVMSPAAVQSQFVRMEYRYAAVTGQAGHSGEVSLHRQNAHRPAHPAMGGLRGRLRRRAAPTDCKRSAASSHLLPRQRQPPTAKANTSTSRILKNQRAMAE